MGELEVPAAADERDCDTLAMFSFAARGAKKASYNVVP